MEETGGVANDVLVVIRLVERVGLPRVVRGREKGHAGETIPFGLVLLLLLFAGGLVAGVVGG